MSEHINIKRLIQGLTDRSQSVRVREAMDPAREWALGLGMTIVLVLLGGLVSYWLYIRTINLEVTDVPVVTDPVSYNGALVEEGAVRFRARAAAYEAIRLNGASQPEIVEPVEVPVVEEEIVEETLVTEEVVETPVGAGEGETGEPELSF